MVQKQSNRPRAIAPSALCKGLNISEPMISSGPMNKEYKRYTISITTKERNGLWTAEIWIWPVMEAPVLYSTIGKRTVGLVKERRRRQAGDSAKHESIIGSRPGILEAHYSERFRAVQR